MDSQNCADVELVENCLNYETAMSISQCKRCKPDFYLSGGTCTTRVDSLKLANCGVYTTDSDLCLTCKDNYVISSDQLKCLPAKNNCLQYVSFDQTGTDAECSGCKDGYYLDTTNFSCKAGTVSNCQTFVYNDNLCSVCKNEYYLNNEACTKHTSQEHCETFSATIPNECDTCANQALRFTFDDICKPRTAIANCVLYSEAELCSECKAGYVVDENDSCLAYAEDPQCRSIDSSSCIECRANHLRNHLGNCIAVPAYLRENCEELQKVENNFECRHCKLNNLPFENDWNKCVLNDAKMLT